MSMSLSIRQRILLTLIPVFLFLTILGIPGVLLLRQLGNSVDVILRENYQSVLAMEELKEALERIDSSFQFVLMSQGIQDRYEATKFVERARKQFDTSLQAYESALNKEQANLTIHPTEDRLVQQLAELSDRYRLRGSEFFQSAAARTAHHEDYSGENGLLNAFLQIKQMADEILQLNQQAMKQASETASQYAAAALTWLTVGLVIAAMFAGLSAWYTIRSTLIPIKAVTQAALGISSGDIDQVVPVISNDELGQLAEAFNVMARRLRDYRQSQLEHLLRAQRTSQATIDSFPDPVLVIDSHGHVEMANPVAQRLLGVKPKNADEPASGIWLPPEPLRQPLHEGLVGQQNYLPESFDRILLLGETGRERAFLPRILNIRDPSGHTLGAAVLLQDVTRFRLLDQMKSNLVATASHELKTPLTSLRLAVHLLLEEAIGPLNPKQIELLLDARENSERLLGMVNNLLDLARLEQGRQQLDIQPTSAATLLRDAADATQVRAKDKNVDVSVEAAAGLPAIAVDATRIGHALRNLLDNALTYTDPGGAIRLSAEADRDAVILSVSDNGAGIPQEFLPHLFEKFFRVPGQTRGSGSGLGLAIVHEIVMAHRGSISCESQPGVGTTFHIRLPIVSAEGSNGEAAASALSRFESTHRL